MLKAALLNDTTRDKGHWGCLHVIQNITSLCLNKNCKICLYDKNGSENFDKTEFCNQISAADIVILNGEGTLHDDAGEVWLQKALLAKELKKKVFLVNAVWQNNPANKRYLSVFDVCSFRETFSFQEAVKDGCKNAFHIPDLSFYSLPELKNLDYHPHKNLAIIDSVKKDITSELIKIAKKQNCDLFFMYHKHWQKQKRNWRYFPALLMHHLHFLHLDNAKQLLPYKSLISGRFHACCMSLMLKIPTFAIESNTWKIKSMFHDAHLDSDFVFETPLQALQAYCCASETLLNQWQKNSSDFAEKAYQDIGSFWNSLF